MNGRRNAQTDTGPIVVIETIKNALRIVAQETDPRLKGIAIDQSLSDARAINPGLHCVPHTPRENLQLLHNIARWCERYTPLVALSGKDGLFLDITGCSHLFGGEANMLEDMQVRLQAQGFAVKLAIADTAGAAWALARYGNTKIADHNEHSSLLASLPLSALRLERNIVLELALVGLKTVRSLIDLPRAPITARFGTHVLNRLDQALGKTDEILSPLQPVAELIYEKRFPDLIVYETDIKATIALLAKQVKTDLEQRGLGIRQVKLQLFRVDGEVTALEVETSGPMRDAKRIASLFDDRLARLHEEWDAGFGFDIIQLSIVRSERLDTKQKDLVIDDSSQEVFTHLADRLSARLGASCVLAYQAADTHIPERQFSLVSTVHHKAQSAALQIQEPATRPILMFERPEIVNVIAEIPEGPPLQFRWRKVQYHVVRSEGPERIACEWWKDGRAAITRDYFRVETNDGYRLWLFRHGLYERETNRPKWYVHGAFA